MANVKASELERDSLVEGNELIVSTDGDGKTRNILSSDLAEFAAGKAVAKVDGDIKKNSEAITDLTGKNAELAAKDTELEAAISANKEELTDKIDDAVKDLQDALAKVSEKAEDTTETDALNKRIADLEQKHVEEVESLLKQHEADVEALVAAHNPWESFGI